MIALRGYIPLFFFDILALHRGINVKRLTCRTDVDLSTCHFLVRELRMIHAGELHQTRAAMVQIVITASFQ